ncbi:MAG: succinate dehydrogenase, hydrophobic membrane anchor protein [Pseudomonadota bacterium]
MSMRTPLGKVLGLGSAREGTEHFWRQRVTAVANIPLTLFLVWLVVSLFGKSHQTVLDTVSSPLVAIGLLLTMASMLYHMRLGMQTIIEDYIHAEGVKILLLMGNTFFTIAIGISAGFAILKLGFGG